jgi:hypothetical protein
MKVCNICEEEKPLSEFYKSKKQKAGRVSKCKQCSRAYNKLWREANPGYDQDWRKKNPDKIRRSYLEWNKRNSKKRTQLSSDWRGANLDKARAQESKRREKNRTGLRLYRNEWCKNKYQSDEGYRLLTNMRTRLYFALKRKGGKSKKTEDLLGCSISYLKILLEAQFQEGMSWDNCGEWHVDHVIPLSSARNDEELYELCKYYNLQPLWADDNSRKGAKVA